MEYTKSVWRDEFERLDFEFNGRKAIVVLPHEGSRTGKWALKTEYFGAFQDLEYELVKRGMVLAFLTNRNRWGVDDDLDAKAAFRDFLVSEFGVERKCVPVGMSCGGLHAIKLAAKHSDMVSCLYLDAPVVNILSCPFGMGKGTEIAESVKQEALDALGLTMREMIAYRDHPLDCLPEVVRQRIPVCLVCGDADGTVPYEENGQFIREAYEKAGIPFLFYLKPGCDHHPHGPNAEDMQAVVDFLIEHA